MVKNWQAPWRSDINKLQYQTLDTLYTEKVAVAWYWRLIAQIAIYMVLGGYLILPTTYDDDPRLRFNRSVLAIIIVALLTGGYSLTALVWFACPSILFRLDSIFIPMFSISIFAFCCSTYTLAASPRFVFSHYSAPITLALTVASALIYGILALIAQRTIRRATRQNGQNQLLRDNAGTPGMYQDPAYYQNFVQNMHPTARSPGAYDPYNPRSPGSFEGPSVALPRQPSEEELVNQQMARLLQRPDISNPTASQSTFRLEWPAGEEPEQLGRQQTFDESGRFLAPGTGGRKRSQSAGNTWGKISNVVRGRPDGGTSGHARRLSRDDRRREIEMNNLASAAQLP